MIVDFSVINFRSIKEKQTFSLIAMNKVKELPANAESVGVDISLLKSAIIYGANGSGKSNLIKAMQALSEIVNGSDNNKGDKPIIHYQPFRLDKESAKLPTQFDITFIGTDKIRYVYSISFNRQEIISESLVFYPGKNPANLFSRKKGTDIISGKSIDKASVQKIEKNLYANQSFLSKIGNERVEGLTEPYNFLTNRIIFYNAFDEEEWVQGTIDYMYSEKYQAFLGENVSTLLKAADIGISEISFKVANETDFKFPESVNESTRQEIISENKYQIKTLHQIYDENNNPITGAEFDLSDESSGTNKFISVAVPILVALEVGGVTIIDELDKSLHPQLTKFLIGLFNSKETNPNNAQLIFASHDVSLLTNTLFRRDQIYFAEKNFRGFSEYYCLGQIQGVRKELSYEKYYMKGVFGGVPKINEFDLQLKFPAIETANN